MKRPRKPVADYFVYLAVRLFVGLCQAMSIEQSYRFADGLAGLLYRLDRRHRKVADENLKYAFGADLDEVGRDQIIRGVYRHFCRMLVEMLHIPRKLHLTDWRERIRMVGHAPLVDRLLDGGPVILVTGHFGNWEMAGYLLGVFGFPPNSVARTLDNPHLDRFLRDFRERTGQRTIPKKGGYEKMLEVLEDGGVLSMLADQDAGQRGLFVPYFGRPASTFKSIALLAIEHRAPILVGGARRVGPGFRYEVICEDFFGPEDWEGRSDDVEWITRRYTVALERLVRRAPEQYLWLHRRWKHQPQPRGKRAKSRLEPGTRACSMPHAEGHLVQETPTARP